jgi:hypothetical protein
VVVTVLSNGVAPMVVRPRRGMVVVMIIARWRLIVMIIAWRSLIIVMASILRPQHGRHGDRPRTGDGNRDGERSRFRT